MSQPIMGRRMLALLTALQVWRWIPGIKTKSFHGTVIVLVISLFLASCSQENSPAVTVEPTRIVAAGDDAALATPVNQTAEVVPTATSLPPSPSSAPIVDVENTTQDLAITAEDIQLFPIPKIISGDRVSFQVQPYVPKELTIENVAVDIYVDGQVVSADTLGWRNWAGRAQGVYEWVWDSSGQPGQHEIRVVLDGQNLIHEGDEDQTNNEATFAIRVGKSSERPLEERDASWITSETDCCVVHAVTRTAAYRDFPELLSLLDSAVSEASSRINEFPEDKLNVYFIERTIGQGGYAGSEMVVVYNDRPYIGGELYELLVHESVHIIDRQFAPQRTKFLAEGVAVWVAGGHYQKQDLQQRAAALLAINEYVPLAELANDFYPAQHEIGYLEAGAFVDYLVGRYGWPEVREFYSNTSLSDGPTEADALDANLQRYFGSSLAGIEAAWLAELAALSPSEDEIADLQTTILYYETARAYQTVHDPTAYFRTAWLPHPADVIETGNAADFMRQPDKEENFTVELMLRSAYDAKGERDFGRANVLLESLERYLAQEGATVDPLVASYQNIVHTAVAFGYEPQRVTLAGETAEVLATTATGNRLFNLDLELQRGDWILHAN